MTTPDDALGPRVHTELTFADGTRMEVSARPRRGGGFTEDTMVALREVGRHGGTGIRLGLLTALLDYAREAGVGAAWEALPAMTVADAQAASGNPDLRPGMDVAAALGRIRLWLKLHPNTVNVAGEMAGAEGFRSPGWPYRLYAVDRRDLEAVLTAAEKGMT